MTKQEFEIKLIGDLVKGIDAVYHYLKDNLGVLQKNKDYFREYFLNDPYYAYWYAEFVDIEPRDDTRKAACKDPWSAYYYALDVDKCPRNDTFKVIKGTEYEEAYLRYIGKPS